MDLDTTRQKESYEKILSAFANQEADILIGTQMIVKGHDFPNVTLVGVLAADLSLHISDYRAAERTFQLLTQAAGRAGRGKRPGEVVIQTYQPEHYAVEAAARQDYQGFFEQEMMFRRMMNYPPVWNMMVIHISSSQETLVNEAAVVLQYRTAAIIRDRQTDADLFGKGKIQIIGPADAAIAKVSDIFRKIIYVKAADYGALVLVKNRLDQDLREDPLLKKVNVQFDFNPMNGF